MPTPLLDFVGKDKKEEGRTILKQLVFDWLFEHGEREMYSFSDEDFDVLKRLVVGGTTRDPHVFSPSGATACSRAIVLDKCGFERSRTDSPQLVNILLDGTWRHFRWQMTFWKMGIVESMELFQSGGKHTWGGSIDLIVKVKVPMSGRTERVIVDIKGANASNWNHIKNTGKPNYDNWIQIQLYLLLHGLKWAILWYENKNTNEIHEVIVKASKKFQMQARRRERYLAKYADARAFPREECNIGDDKDRRFRYCPQRKNCQRLPVHLVKNGKVFKIGEPRIRAKSYKRYDIYPLKKSLANRVGRARPLKKFVD